MELQGKDADGDPVTYAATALPSGLSISNSGLISGTIASNADTNSPYAVTVTASDGTKTTTQNFLWTVSQTALTAPSNQTNTEGDNVSLQLQGTASIGSLTYNASGLPNGLSINPTTGLISGTIAAGDAANGPYTVNVSATNGTDSASQTFTWTVNPVVTLTDPADQSNLEGNNVSLQVSATDSLGKALTYSAANLPTGLSINSSTGQITGTVSSGDSANSPYPVTVTASDGTYSSNATFTWSVTHTDTTALTMTNPGTQANVSGDSVNLQINASDPDGIDTLAYSATGLPDGLSIDPFSGIISGTIADDAVSNTPNSVTVTADDGNGQSASQTFTWLVNASVLMDPTSPISAVEGNDTGSITVATFTTPDLNSQAGDFTATINYGDGTTDIGTVSGSNGSFTATGDHTYAEMGSYPVSIIITDTFTGASTAGSTTATVTDAALQLTGGLQLGDPMTDPQSTFELASFTDGNPDAQASDYSVQIAWGDGTNSQGNYVQSAGNGVFVIVAPHNYPTLTPTTVGPVTYTATVTVTDVDGASASTSSTIVVGQIAAGVPATMGGWVFVDQNTYASASDFEANGQTGVALINWGDGNTSLGTISGGPGNGSGPVQFSITAAHTYAQDSYEQPNGQYTITVTVSDDDGNTLSGTQYVSVVRPPMAGLGDNVEGQPNVELNNVQVAEFTVPDTTDGSSEFSAMINWGDGISGSGTINEVSPGLFEVIGSHTYASVGPYVIQVEVSQDWNTSLPVMMISSVAMIGQGQQTAKDTFTVETKPNMAAAINNKFVPQYGRVEVLKGWETRYIAPNSVDPKSVKWFWGGKQQETGKVLVATENKIGTFEVIMQAIDARSRQQVKAERLVVVGNVTPKLTLTPGPQYTRNKANPNEVDPPPPPTNPLQKNPHAMNMDGTVSLGQESKNANVSLMKFRWGYVQSFTGSFQGNWGAPQNPADVTWLPGETTGQGPALIYQKATFKNTNDAFKLGHQLYAESVDKALGENYSVWDDPSVAANRTVSIVDSNNKNVAIAHYPLIKNSAYNAVFHLFEVAFNTATQQYVPVAEQTWQLKYDTNDNTNAWSAEVVDKVAKTSNFDPLPSATTSTSSIMNTPPEKEGTKVFTKPKN